MKKLIILLFSILISFSSVSVFANNELNPPPNTIIAKKDGELTMITNAKNSDVVVDGERFVLIYKHSDDVIFLRDCISCRFYAITSNNINIDGLDGILFTEEQSTRADGRWIQSKGIVSLGEPGISTFSIPGNPKKYIGVIKNTYGSAGGSFKLYKVDITTGEVASTQLDWGENEITSSTYFKSIN